MKESNGGDRVSGGASFAKEGGYRERQMSEKEQNESGREIIR